MKKMYRTVLFAGVAAFGLAACGDDVTVVEPTPPPTPALQVSLTPSNQTVNVGAVADFVVTIAGGADGAAASWTCGSSAPAVASVAATATGCRATGAAAGAATITATVTKGNQSASAGGQITVNALPTPPAPPTVVPATVTIASITTGNTFTPVVLNNVFGQIDVTLNINPNDQRVTRAEVLVDGVVAATQNVVIGVAGEDAAEAAVQQVILSLNTAAYAVNATAGTAAPTWLNGQRQVSARITVQGATTVPAASNVITLNFNNADGIHLLGTLPTNSATDAIGQVWYGGPNAGSTTFTAIPVMYSGRSIASVTYAAGFCAAAGTEVTTVAAAPFTFSRRCATTSATGLAPQFNTMGTDGNAGPAVAFVGGFLNNNHPFPVRVDNVAPAGAALVFARQASINNRESWGNAAYTIVTGYTAPADAGVGLPVGASPAATRSEARFQIRTGTTVVAGHSFADNVTVLAGLDNSVNNTTYNAQVQVTDRLGNVATVTMAPNAGHAAGNAGATSHYAAVGTLGTFGVDKDAPAITRGNIAPGANITVARSYLNVPTATGAGVALNDQFQVNSTDIISGFAAPGISAGDNALLRSYVQVLGTPNAPTTLVRNIVGGIGTGTPNAAPFARVAANQFVATAARTAAYAQTPTSITMSGANSVTVPVALGYHIFQAQTQDKAGNLSPVLSWEVYVNNNNAPIITGLVAPGVFTGGAPAVFPATAQDGVEVFAGSVALQYPAIGRLVYEANNGIVVSDNAASATLFDDKITIPETLNLTAPAFIRNLQVVTAAPAHAPPAAGSAVIPNAVSARVYNGYHNGLTAATRQNHRGSVGGVGGAVDVARGASALLTAGILPTQVVGGTNFIAAAVPVRVGQFVIESYTTSAAAAGNVTATIRVRATGPTGTFVNPFGTRLALVERVADPDGGLDYLQPVTTTFAAQFSEPFPTLDNGAQRDYVWTFTVTRATGAIVNFHVVGLSADFDGLTTRGTTITFTAGLVAATTPAYF
jgi:hypothetical protein